jgi:hypothetical protein
VRYEISTNLNFNEEKYLAANPDVVQGILRKEFKSGHNHFENSGYLEKRVQKISLEKDLPLAVVHVPKCAGTSLRIEIDRVSSNMYVGSKYSVRKPLRKFFRTFNSTSFDPELIANTWTIKDLQAARNQYDCVMGHISLQDFHQADFRDFLVVVREPRVRLLSEFSFLFSNSAYKNYLEKFSATTSKEYFQNYASKVSRNVIHNLTSGRYIFDWLNKDLNISCYWNDEVPRIMLEMFGREAQNIRVNGIGSKSYEIDFRVLDLIHELTEKDSAMLNRLMNSGLLTERSKEKMDKEFGLYIKQNFNYVKKLI